MRSPRPETLSAEPWSESTVERPCALSLRIKMARPERLELPTLGFEDRYSIQLSYGRVDAVHSIGAGGVERPVSASGAGNINAGHDHEAAKPLDQRNRLAEQQEGEEGRRHRLQKDHQRGEGRGQAAERH